MTSDDHHPRESSDNEPLPAINSIHKGRVKSIQDYGAFISIENFKKQGLCHISQISKNKLEGGKDGKIIFSIHFVT